jgi:hypothetical protein
MQNLTRPSRNAETVKANYPPQITSLLIFKMNVKDLNNIAVTYEYTPVTLKMEPQDLRNSMIAINQS